MSDIYNEKQEIKYLENVIAKLKTQANLHFIFMFVGILISILSLIYFAMNPDVVGGSLTLLFIGVAIVIYNVILRKNKLNRASQLSQDLEKQKKIKDSKL